MHELSCVRQVHAGMCANLNLRRMTDFFVGASDRLTLASFPHAACVGKLWSQHCHNGHINWACLDLTFGGYAPYHIVVIASVFRDF